jgi:hypothetical protein
MRRTRPGAPARCPTSAHRTDRVTAAGALTPAPGPATLEGVVLASIPDPGVPRARVR